MERALHPPLGKTTGTTKKLNETPYPPSSAAPLRALEGKSLKWGRPFDARKKQDGLQQGFVKFSLGLKGQQGPSSAKQERRENKPSDGILQTFPFH